MTSLLVLLALCGAAEPAADAAVDTVVVCPNEFRAALAPWLAHRAAQGHRVAVVSNLKSPAELRAEVRRIAASGKLRFLLLVGDADPAMASDARRRALSVPTHYTPAVVNVRWGSEPEIATDNWYADLDDDRVPELAVGRLTADSAAELERMVAKILAYETCPDFGRWRRQVHFVAGLGGFGAVADAALEGAAKTLITAGVPAAYSTTMTYGSWQSPYCPDPRQFGRVTIDRLNEGSLFWVYIGHGEQRAVDLLRVPGGAYPIFSSRDAQGLSCRHGAPIACFLACYSGAFDQSRDCLAEELLRNPGGPVAILCGSRVTMPYALSVLGSELLGECFGRHPATIGEAIVAAKRRTMQPASDNRQRAAIDALAKAFGPSSDAELEAERAEHLDLFQLLGDPLMRLPFPSEVTIDAQPAAVSGESLEIVGNSPVAGACTVELVVRRDRLTFHPPRRGQFDPGSLGSYGEVYERANEPRLASTQLARVDGRFAVRLAIPPTARGACHVRVFVEGAGACAAGAADIRIDGPDETTAKRP